MTAQSATFAFGIANLGRGVSDNVFQAQIHRILTSKTLGTYPCVIGLQEIDEADKAREHELLRRRAGRSYRFVGFSTACPILVHRSLDITGRKVTFAAPGLARVTPHRVVTEARIDPGASWLPLLVVLNTHLPVARKTTRLRRALVRANLALRALRHTSRGRVVVWIADTNTRGPMPRLMARERVLVDAGIDRIHISKPRRIKMTVIERETIRLAIDKHDAHAAVVTFTRKGKR